MAKKYKRFIGKHQSKIWSCIVKSMNENGWLVNVKTVRNLFERYFRDDISPRQIGMSMQRFEKRHGTVIVHHSDESRARSYVWFKILPKIPFVHRVRFAFLDSFIKWKS